MSLYGMMRTGVSGMNAQANRLASVADNIANSGTTGYKRSGTEFSSLIIPATSGNYSSGGVTTTVRVAVSQQGDLKYTQSGSDLAINGQGFFVVQDANGGTPVLTRAGSFVPDGEGRLVNSAGYYLMGYSFANGVPSATTNGFSGLQLVSTAQQELAAVPSANGIFTANLPAGVDAVPAGSLPSDNDPASTYSAKSSMVVYDNLGGEVILDIYYTKTAANTWEVSVYNQANASPNTSFPYSPVGSGPIATETLSFDGTTGKLTTGSAKDITVPIPNGLAFELDLQKMTQLSMTYTLIESKADGNKPSGIEGIEISNDGTMYAKYENGSYKALYRIPLANVQSPDQMIGLAGNVFTPSADSGSVEIGFANEGGLGGMISGALESSNVDIADELTNMIESQRSYTANSKVFQTGSELMDVLVNLKR